MSALEDAAKYAGAAATVAGTGYGFWEWVLKPFQRRIQREREHRSQTEALIRELPEVKESINKLTKAIEGIASELRHHAAMSSARSRAIAVSHHTSMWESDEEGRAVWLSPAMLSLLEMAQEDARGFGWKAGIHPDDIDMVDDAWTRAVRDKRIFDLEYRVRGGTKVRGYASTIRDGEGLVRGFVGTLSRV